MVSLGGAILFRFFPCCEFLLKLVFGHRVPLPSVLEIGGYIQLSTTFPQYEPRISLAICRGLTTTYIMRYIYRHVK